MAKTEFVLRQSNESELPQIPEDVLESVKKAICEKAANQKFEFNDHSWLCQDFYDAVKNCLISVGMFNPQTDELSISSPARESDRVDVKITKRVFEFDITIAQPDK